MSDWNPELYRRFEAERTRPAIDLLARVGLDAPRAAFDLGCGPGNSTELLVRRWPASVVAGIDSSEAMLASARQRLAQVRFEQADVTSWRPDVPPDLIFANAVLQWVGDHESLFPRLASLLAPGGVLAVQMPDNLDEPSHTAMREVAALPAFATRIGEAGSVREAIARPGRYHDWLVAGGSRTVDVWRTTYFHPMPSAAAIVDWLRSTGLKPFLEPLDDDARTAFLREYEARIDAAYPPLADGTRLLAFPRLFIVATRPA